MGVDDVRTLIVALAQPASRERAADDLARRCGAARLMILVKDAELGSLIPAAGFPQVLAGGPEWRAFLRACREDGTHRARVHLAGTEHDAVALTVAGVAAVFLGEPDAECLECLREVMPLLAHALVAEQEARFARASADDARTTARRAATLASSLESARAEHARLNERLHEEHRRKDDFLAMLAHELRNPLAPLVTSIELIRRCNGVATERQLDIMSRQLRQLSRLVEDLLDVSRVSRGRIELRRQRMSLADVLAHAVDASRPLLESRRHRLFLEPPSREVEVHADAVRLTQVFTNILHNAAKYTDPGGEVHLRAGAQGGHAVVSIRDSGIGIEPEMLPRVFDLFVQAPTSLARSQGGLGIGLRLVKALVELHEGNVSVSSEGLGRGSTFTVSLPVMRPADCAEGAAQPPVVRRDDVASRVLVVDDNEDAANSMADMLRLMGHHAEVAFSGLTAIHRAGDLQPDLVMLDIGLPDMDGYETARRLRLGAVPARLVAVTGYGSEADRRRSIEAGFDEHIVKPVMPEALEALMARMHAPPSVDAQR